MLARLRTPSPPRKGLTRKLTDDVMTPRPGKHSNGFLDDKVDEDTQTDGDRRWESDSPALTRTKRSRSTLGATKAGGNMTLREQEKVRYTCLLYIFIFQNDWDLIDMSFTYSPKFQTYFLST